MGLQKRISLALTAVIMLFVAVQGYLAYSSLEQQEDELVDAIVMSETRRLIEGLERGDKALRPADQPHRLGPNLTAWLLTAAGARSPALPQYLHDLPAGPHMLHSAQRVYHVVIEPTGAGRLVVQFDATANEEFVYQFGRYLFVTGALCILLGWAISTFLARIVVAPFRRLTERLTKGSPGSADGAASRSDEETLLLQAFDQAQRRLEESLAREREFAANVRHEVRTPLAALRTDAEMLLLTESLTTPAQERLQRMIAAVDNVASGVDALHALSSAMPGKAEPVSLAQCVDDVWQSLGHLAADNATTLANELPSSDVVELDRPALVTILRNLLRNAIEHASPGVCRVSRIEGGIKVADDGPGIAAEHRPFVFDRYFQGRLADAPRNDRADKGLGLAIARQTADLRGWTLEIEASDGRGTAFNLVFGQPSPS